MSNVDLIIPALPDHGLSVRRFEIVEGLSMPFEVALAALSKDADIDFERAIGAAATCRVDRGPLGARAWTGVIAHIEQTAVDPAGLASYTLRIVPRFSLLAERWDNRIFQHQSALDIVASVLDQHGVSWVARVDPERAPKLEARVQYAESDLAFVSRILEEAGITYLFEEHEGGTRLALTDHPESAPPIARGPLPFSTRSSHEGGPHVYEVTLAVSTRPGRAVLADFDPRRPHYPLAHRAKDVGPGEDLLEQFAYLPGAAIIESKTRRSNDTPTADDQSEARADEHQGHALAARRLGSPRRDRRRVSFSTNIVDLAAGAVFSIDGAPRPELERGARLVVTEARCEGDIDGDWVFRGAAAFAAAPLLPLAKTPRPTIEGVESAIVTGPEGAEIHTDEFGRVRVRFHWDRAGLGDHDTKVAIDDRHSAWLRVDEGWAGAGFGMVSPPRVGQEVLVGFYEGNPDQPVIVGRVFGASNPAPHGLPGAKSTTVWRTRASPSSEGFHEISFEDERGRERLFVQSERDLEKQVNRDEDETVGRDHKEIVGESRGATIATEDTVLVGKLHEAGMAKMGEMHILTQGQPAVGALPTRYELIAKRITLSTGGAMIVLDGPDITVTAQSNVRIEAGDTLEIQGRPFVHINPPMVSREADEAKSEPPPDDVVTFQLLSEEGLPIAGARVHVAAEGGKEPLPQVTDGHGKVRFPASQGGDHSIVLGGGGGGAGGEGGQGEGGGGGGLDVGKTPSQKTPIAKPTKHKLPISLQIILPDPKKKLEIDPGAYPDVLPFMPSIPLHAKVLVAGAPTTLGFVRWEFYITGQYRVAEGGTYRMQSFKHPAGTTRTKPNEEVSFRLAPAQIVGGDLEIKATYHGEAELGHVTITKVEKRGRVVGKNPARADVEKAIVAKAPSLAWVFLRIFCHESLHKLAQFTKEGEPLYGDPAGVGIVQRDPEPGEWQWPKAKLSTPNNFFPRIYWDWTKNLDEGIHSFQSTYVERGRADLDALRKLRPDLPEYSEGVLMRAAIRRYNGGVEWACDDGLHYVVRPTYTGNPTYVSDVLHDEHGSSPKHPIPEDARARTWPAPPKKGK